MRLSKSILMIKRLVKMHFSLARSAAFEEIFNSNSENIKSAPGCVSLRLLRGAQDSGLFFTESVWKSESYLDKYRQSALFKDTWSKVRPLFDEAPEAWTLILENENY